MDIYDREEQYGKALAQIQAENALRSPQRDEQDRDNERLWAN